MKPMVIDGLVQRTEQCVAGYKLGPGCYARYLWNDEKGTRKMGRNEYGCSDAANILYTIGAFPTVSGTARRHWRNTRRII